VNRLVSALIARPQVIDRTAGYDRASFELLLDALGDDLLSGRERDPLRSDPALSRRLREGYLPIISASEWQDALSLAANRTASSSGWRTVMIAAVGGHAGLTAPQDSSLPELVALFTGSYNDPGVLIYDPTLRSVTALPGGAHCGVPSRGLCSPGACGGCAPATVYDTATGGRGIKCVCPDQR
jgi:hypothetical protein